MSDEYTFWHMLKDVIFNGNKVSGGKMIARKSRIFRGTDILVTFHPHANQEISIHQILQGKRSEVSLATTI